MHKSNTKKIIFIYIICCFSITHGMSQNIPETPPGNEENSAPTPIVNKAHKANYPQKTCLLFSSALMIPILLQLILKIDTPSNQNAIHLRDCNICPNVKPPEYIFIRHKRYINNETHVNFTAQCKGDSKTRTA
jgi:hypothetical protein